MGIHLSFEIEGEEASEQVKSPFGNFFRYAMILYIEESAVVACLIYLFRDLLPVIYRRTVDVCKVDSRYRGKRRGLVGYLAIGSL